MDELEIIKLALDSVKDLGLLVIDKNGKIIIYNKASADSDGISQSDAIGKPFEYVFENPTTPSPTMETLRTGKEHIDMECVYETNEKTRNRTFGNAYPIKKDGQAIGAITIVRFDNSFKRLLAHTIELQKELTISKSQKSNGTRYTLNDLIFSSRPMYNTVTLAKRASMSNAPVMIYGETGTGKELIAQGIHNASSNCKEPFIAVNCSAIPDNLLESTLFGTTKGAYTGAVDAKGLFVQAGSGTLFLDELNSMPLNLQAKLLRVIQEKHVRPLGSEKEIPINCRMISSCNRHPVECIQQEILRKDLYYRLSVICIELPPLRNRKEDIPLLTNYYLEMYSKIYAAGHVVISAAVEDIFMKHNWPGNVRELQHVIESAVIQTAPEEEIKPQHLHPYLRHACTDENGPIPHSRPSPSPAPQPEGTRGADLRRQLEDYERNVLREVLYRCNWNISQAAREVGYTRSNLQYRIQKLGLYNGKH